jgi:hypothetical protein
MKTLPVKLLRILQNLPTFLIKHKYHVGASLAILLWCYPYFTTGNKLALGDFTFFCQAYEAMRVSILEYHQFPWFNPWMSGGVPLYANPQMGFFSIQMPLVLLFGTVQGLKLALVVYTFAGYASMYLLLRKYFKVSPLISTLLSLVWLFSSFFVAHLPAHYTFAWYMLAPGFFYLALTVKNWKGGLWLGGAFAIMALAQIHNAFMHITLISSFIILARLAFDKNNRKAILKALLAAAVIFAVVAGHRFFYTFQNVHDFPREVVDVIPHPLSALLGVLLPLSMARPLQFFNYPQNPYVPHGYHEATATIGIFALITLLMSLFFVGYQIYSQKRTTITILAKQYKLHICLLGLAALFLLTGFGSFAPWAPYSLIKHLPVFNEMRVCTRWFLFFDLTVLIFIGVVVDRAPRKHFFRFAAIGLLCLGVVELLTLNVGYQAATFNAKAVVAPKDIKSYAFVQTSYFGETRKLVGGGTIPNDGNMPAAYREYEATTYNEGILYANDALVQLALDPRRSPGHPTCPIEEGCQFVRSNNAKVVSWSPNKIVLERTGKGNIYLNMNNSNYFVINGKRNENIKVAEPFNDFVIKTPENQKTITIQVKPTMGIIFHKLANKLDK